MPNGQTSTVLLHLLAEYNLEQLIREPTHIKGNTQDLLCTDLGGHILDHTVINPGVSDHYLISATITSPIAMNTPAPSSYRVYSKADLPLIHDSLADLNDLIQSSIDNGESINIVWDSFRNGLFAIIDKAVPQKVSKPKPPHETYWFSVNARRACSKQRRLYRLYKKTGDLLMLANYKQMRRANKKLFRSLKRKFMVKSLYNPLISGNSKHFYQFVRKVRGDRSTVQSIETNTGEITQNPSHMANIFNQYFQSVFSPPGPTSQLPPNKLPTRL